MVELIENSFIVPLLIALLFQLLFFFGLFSRLAFYKKKEEELAVEKPVSVIISAKNEEENLRENLPAILGQDYPDFEVIVVDDQSDDGTMDYLKEVAESDEKLKIVYLNKHVRDHIGKKLSLSLGIRKASNDILLMTDADCKPVSSEWIRMMVRNYTDGKQIVLGYSPYQRKDSLINLFVQFETFYAALQYISFSLAGMTYMGVGRNLSYLKQVFLKTGFSSHLHVPYGDDDLFVNETANKTNVAIELDKRSFIMSEPPANFKQWFRQKLRHLKGGREYRPVHKKWLGYLWMSNFLFYGLMMGALILDPSSLWAWSIFGIRFLSMISVFVPALMKLNNIRLIWFVPVLDIFYQVFYYPLMGIIALVSRKENGW